MTCAIRWNRQHTHQETVWQKSTNWSEPLAHKTGKLTHSIAQTKQFTTGSVRWTRRQTHSHEETGQPGLQEAHATPLASTGLFTSTNFTTGRLTKEPVPKPDVHSFRWPPKELTGKFDCQILMIRLIRLTPKEWTGKSYCQSLMFRFISLTPKELTGKSDWQSLMFRLIPLTSNQWTGRSNCPFRWPPLTTCKSDCQSLMFRLILLTPKELSGKSNSKHWFTTSFLQPLLYLVTP